MRRNVGGMDRRARLLLGPVLLAVGLKKGGRSGFLMFGTGIILIATGTIGYCPANGALGVDTSR